MCLHVHLVYKSQSDTFLYKYKYVYQYILYILTFFLSTKSNEEMLSYSITFLTQK